MRCPANKVIKGFLDQVEVYRYPNQPLSLTVLEHVPLHIRGIVVVDCTLCFRALVLNILVLFGAEEDEDFEPVQTLETS